MTSPRPGVSLYERVGAPGKFGVGNVMVTFLGTTTLLFDDGKTQFLIDGFLSCPAMMRSMRLETDAHLRQW
jgi:hypothetical protein